MRFLRRKARTPEATPPSSAELLAAADLLYLAARTRESVTVGPETAKAIAWFLDLTETYLVGAPYNEGRNDVQAALRVARAISADLAQREE